MLSERYSTFSSTGTRSAAPPRTTRKPTVDALPFLVDDGVLPAVEDRHRRGRHLDVVAREQRHRRKHAEQPEQDGERNRDGRELQTQQTHRVPPVAARGGATINQSPRSAVITTSVPRGNASPSGRAREVLRTFARANEQRPVRRRRRESRPTPRPILPTRRRHPVSRSRPAANAAAEQTDRRAAAMTTPADDADARGGGMRQTRSSGRRRRRRQTR